MNRSPRGFVWIIAAVVVGALVSPVASHGALVTAGELVADLRAMDLNASSTIWTNRDGAGATVGNFTTKGGGNVNVVTLGGYKAVNIGITLNNALLSATQTPTSLESNSTRSVEAWIYPNSTLGGQTAVGWGVAGTATMSSFRYANNTGNGMFSGWFIDAGWTISQVGQWTHVVWTYDGTSVRGYINGSLVSTVDLSADTDYPLKTSHNKLVVGAEREAATGAFDGYIADVRVHTGVLSAANVAMNFNHGIQSTLPVITGLSNQTVVAGNSLVLNPTATGFPQPVYQWLSNSVSLAGQTNLSLALNNIQYAQNNTVYSLVATNAAGKVTNSMTLTVLVTPSITGLNSQAVAPGSNVTIAATVAGVPTPALQWRLNGVNLSDGPTGNGSSIAGSTMSTLTLNNAQVADTGTYSLVASNTVSVVTNSMTLTISGGDVAPTITGPSDQTVVQGSNAIFSASVSGLPLPSLLWLLNGAEISGATNPSLTVFNVLYSQNGDVYSLVASNSAGVVTNNATLFVLVPPAITQQPTNFSATVGSSAAFSVVASGVPSVKYQWRRNGGFIANATNATYVIGSVTAANNGDVYSVIVSNSVTSVASSNATLTALSTLTRTLLPTNNATGIAEDQQLHIVFSGPVKLGSNGVVTVRDAANGAVVSTVDRSQFVSYTPGNTSVQSIPNAAIRSVQGKTYYYMPIAVYDNEVWITLSNRLGYNKTFYVNMDAGLLRDTNNASISAITGTNAWRFSTKPAPLATPGTATGLTTLTVGQDGTGDFATFQGAFDWVPQNNTLPRTIRVRLGVYRDNATLGQNRNFVTVVGEGASRTNAQLVYPFAYFAPPSSVFTAGSLRIESSDVSVVNLTLDNIIYKEYHPTGESTSGAAGAFAGAINTLATTGRRIVLKNVLIKGGQDTIYHNSGTGVVYFHGCEVWGSVDYIYGDSLAVYDQCNIVEIRSSGGPITAPNTAYAQPFGIVFLNSTFPRALIANGYPYDVSAGATTFQRPWQEDAYTAVINCAVGTQITAAGWQEWTSTDGRENTCRAREMGTTLIGGGSVTPAQRQAAGAYWLNTLDPDYTNNPSLLPTDALIDVPTGTNNRVAVTMNSNDFTVDAIFGHSYFGLGSWRPTVAPAITAHPTNQTVNAGAGANFAVTAVGLPAPTFQWQKNGTNIAGATNASFAIASAILADSGPYSVVVSNSAGVATSSSAQLAIPAEPVSLAPTVTNGALTVTWPAPQTGYRLLIQTNAAGVGLTTNWTPVANSANTNQTTVPIDPVNGSIFLRLTYP